MLINQLHKLFLQHPVVTTDSRVCPQDAIFFALKGDNFNGNQFAEAAIEKGCAYAVVDEWDEQKEIPQHIVLVDDVLRTLQELANYHRRQFKMPVIAITGTNGKTTTKELVAAVLSKEFKVIYTQGNFNNHIGVPLTLLSMTEEHEIAVIEMGANHMGEIKELCEIAEPDFGLITNVGVAHIDGFGSVENIVKTKKELFDYLELKGGKAFVNHSLKDKLQLSTMQMNMNEYGVNNPSLFVSGSIEAKYPYLEVGWMFSRKEYKTTTNLVGDYNLDNVLAAITVGCFFGVNSAFINDAIESYIPQNSRSQYKRTERNTLIIDSYNANPTSMRAALEHFVDYPQEPKALIIGEMRELGGVSKEEHQQLVDLIDAYHFDVVYLIGKAFGGLQTDYPIYDDIGELMVDMQNHPIENHCVLVKGSNGVQLDKIVEFL